MIAVHTYRCDRQGLCASVTVTKLTRSRHQRLRPMENTCTAMRTRFLVHTHLFLRHSIIIRSTIAEKPRDALYIWNVVKHMKSQQVDSHKRKKTFIHSY